MTDRRRQWLFILAGLAFAILVMALPAGSFWKNVSALTLAAIVLLALYPGSAKAGSDVGFGSRQLWVESCR